MNIRLSCVVVLGACIVFSPISANDERRVNIYRLLADPASVDSQIIVVRGYCCPLGEELGIFPSSRDCSEGNSISGVRLNGSEELVKKVRGFDSGKICTVKGIFKSWEGKVSLDSQFENGEIETRVAFPY